ncbi:MAG: serine/threonine protein phosphatase [Bradyrhizobium sp.]|nr:serine/threonine protein phosphatase [Bradyrhizobium sp.]
MTRTYAIGDIHGCLDKLIGLMALCYADAGNRPTKFIFLGDYIDRGPNSQGVVEFLMSFQQDRPDDVICLMGNHEDMLLAAVDAPDWEESWLRNGGIQTLQSYREATVANIPQDHINWIRNLPKVHDDGLRFFVHAGIHPDRPLNRQDEHDLLWIREPFLSSTKDFSRLVVHGHTPLKTGKPDIRPNRLNLDTAAVYGGPLTSAVFDSASPEAIGFLGAT